MKTFDVPEFFRSPIISCVKDYRRGLDPRKRDLTPTILDFGPIRFKVARHFGFCYGVENAVEIAYRTLEEHPDRRVFLLSEMIHNPHVNDDLQGRGVRFLRTSTGEELIGFDELVPDDIVIIPAFGISIKIKDELEARGVDTTSFDTTCPFVEKVWNKSKQIGARGHTVVVHGKRYHEETRATISHARQEAPVVVVLDIEEAEDLAKVIRGEWNADRFHERFADRYSVDFCPERDLTRIGVVNQTTMLATETQLIADLLRSAMVDRYGAEAIDDHFADTSDTLCYATNENQAATRELIESGGDLAIIVGGYNSSNTGHLVELAEEAMPTYFVRSADEIASPEHIRHFDLRTHEVVETTDWLPDSSSGSVDIALTAGASCPDALLDQVIRKVVGWYEEARPIQDVLNPYQEPIPVE